MQDPLLVANLDLARRDIHAPASEEVVDAQDLMSSVEQAFAQMTAEEAGTACDQYPFSAQAHIVNLASVGVCVDETPEQRQP